MTFSAVIGSVWVVVVEDMIGMKTTTGILGNTKERCLTGDHRNGLYVDYILYLTIMRGVGSAIGSRP